MYTELIKIIEGGLAKDSAKVTSYAKFLADKLHKDGDFKLSEKIYKVLNNTKSQAVYLDQMINTPVDHETRLSIIDFYMPSDESVSIYLSNNIQNTINNFINISRQKNKINDLGIDIKSSLLLYGPPGCGKTSLAFYISKALNLPLVVTRLDSLVSSLLGNTAKNLRKVFEFANRQPCILFLDEFDAIAKARDDNHELGELKRVINSLLQNIDEFSKNNILIAATNHHELLDKAIWRRFNNIIEIGMPQNDEIESIIKKIASKYPNDFINDPKKLEKLLVLFNNHSPANIETIIQNSIAKSIINAKNTLIFEDLIFEIFSYDKRGVYSQEELINFFILNGISQHNIKEFCNISIRQVRNAIRH